MSFRNFCSSIYKNSLIPLKIVYYFVLSCLASFYFYFKTGQQISISRSIKNSITESHRTICQNQDLNNVPMNTNKHLNCLDLSTKLLTAIKTNEHNKPLVINFGSFTSEKFTSSLAEWRLLTSQFSHTVDFLVVYTSEGMSCSKGSKYFKYGKLKETSIFERIAKAEKFCDIEKPNCRVFVDNMNNGCSRAFGSVPQRHCVVFNGRISYLSDFGDWNYQSRRLQKVFKLETTMKYENTNSIYPPAKLQ